MTAPPGLSVVDLRTEYTVELLGTEVALPRLSWRLESGERGVEQASYRVRAAASAEALDGTLTPPFTLRLSKGTRPLETGALDESRASTGSARPDAALLFDSGVIASSAQLDIAYAGPPLVAMQRVWWSVEVTDTNGRIARSAPTWFETGLADDDWRADWIVAEDTLAAADRAAGLAWVWSETPLDDRPHAFRLDFDAADDVVSADILIAGKDHLRGVWVNGVASDLPRPFGWDTMLPFWGTLEAYAGTVQPGRNSICALIEADTVGFFPVDGGAFAALIRLHHADGRIERVVSGPAWRFAPNPPVGWTEASFDASDWQIAVASGADVHNDPRPPEPATLLRTGFTPAQPVVAARLYATALGAYDARINRRAVSTAILAPEMTVAQDHILYQVHDVTDLIVPGENALGAIIADGWYASAFGWRIERYGFGPAPRRFRAQLRLDYADGTSAWVTTGEDWRVAASEIVQSEIYDGESVDLRLAMPGWDLPGFDASGWASAQRGATPTTQVVAQTSPALERTREMCAVAVTEPVAGRYVFDFGQNFSGWVRIAAEGPAGTTITAKFAELLNSDGTTDLSNLRLAKATDSVVLAGGGVETFEPRFTYHGFRYVEIEGFPGIPTREEVVGVVVHSACRETGTIDFLDAPLLQTIWQNALWSQRSNFFSVPTDCPQRDERMGWMGDIQVFLDAAAFNMEVDPFIRRFLLEARAAQRPDGAYPIVVPQPLSFPDVVTAGWSEAGIILPWQLWQRYGDTAVIDENWAAMEAWMAYVVRGNPDHVWRNDRGLDLGDWLSVDAIKPDDETTPRVLCATAYWAWCAELMAAMARATGRVADAARYDALHMAIRGAFVAEFVRDDGVAGNGSQTSQVLALHMRLVPAPQRAAAAQVLAADIRARGMKLSTGFLGTPYLLDVLADAGLWDEVSGLLLQTAYPSWGYMPETGATTMWERWNGDVGDLSMNSYNHYAFGAVVGFFYRRLAGIAPAAPGFGRIAVRPVWLPAVGRVSARYDSVVGTIATATEGDASGLTGLSLSTPPNTIAEVELPAGRTWRENGVVLDAHPDIRNIRHHGDLVRFEVGSGDYRFTL
ncbi:alpha-L-rhamnosidase [Sphingomonas glacialis]|uniref:alpha-L-rhamnosidase n=1 Tax=Sphingomonas glacialis TaxID=658225 RepID=A0A502FRW2_9SPHN|nr:alpha-L-rhamnosidase [Sphingomonas glacialis]TPG52120.1 alpha-L-rhamnosidase [Sphingomonas glacialis]